MSDVEQINCRADCAGGDIDAVKAWAAVPALRGRPHLILLIHGFNNTFCEARQSYRAFGRLQAESAPKGQDWAFGATIVEVYWPGDAQWGFIKPVYYPWSIKKAIDTAKVLSEIVADLLAHNNGELILDIVAHSLGNRVALHMLSALAGSPGLVTRRVVHMAAAVPTWRLEDQKDVLSAGIDAEIRHGKATSLYSDCDGVLAYAFPPGETAAIAQGGFLPVALGHEKWIRGDSLPNFTQYSESPAGHGDYWGGKASQPLQSRIRDVVHDAMELAVAPPRNPASRSMPARPDSEARTIDAHAVASRAAGTSLDDACGC